jgi:ribosomal protein S7
MLKKSSYPIVSVYSKFVGSLTKKGERKEAKTLLNLALASVSTETKLPQSQILLYLFKVLNCKIEVITISLRKKQHLVPFIIGFNRRCYLVIKWILSDTQENDNLNSPLFKRLAKSIAAVLLNSPTSKAIKLRNMNLEKAGKSRSNLHFRW